MFNLFERGKAIKRTANDLAALIIYLQEYLPLDVQEFVTAARERNMVVGQRHANDLDFFEEKNPNLIWTYIGIGKDWRSLMIAGHDEWHGLVIAVYPKESAKDTIVVKAERSKIDRMRGRQMGKDARALCKALLEFPEFRYWRAWPTL